MSIALARATDPGTSHEAAASLDPTILEQVVVGAVMTCPNGATQDDVLAVLLPKGYSHSSITPRFRPLLNKGILVETGEKRKGASNRNQRVVRVADATRQAVEIKNIPLQIERIELPRPKSPYEMTEEEAAAALSEKIDGIKKLMKEVEALGDAHSDLYGRFYVGDLSVEFDADHGGWSSSY